MLSPWENEAISNATYRFHDEINTSLCSHEKNVYWYPQTKATRQYTSMNEMLIGGALKTNTYCCGQRLYPIFNLLSFRIVSLDSSFIDLFSLLIEFWFYDVPFLYRTKKKADISSFDIFFFFRHEFDFLIQFCIFLNWFLLELNFIFYLFSRNSIRKFLRVQTLCLFF